MSRAKIMTDGSLRFFAIEIQCPAGHTHLLPTDWTPSGMERSPHEAGRAAWNFNGNLDRPTFAPSLLWRTGHFVTGTPPSDCRLCKGAAAERRTSYCGVCHSFVRDGRIEFLSDCTHALAGQTVDLPEIT